MSGNLKAYQMSPTNKLILEIGDLTTWKGPTKGWGDAIVNAGGQKMEGGPALQGAIYRGAGPELLKYCQSLPIIAPPDVRCPLAGAKLTKGYNLKADYIIHTVPPVYQESARRYPQRSLKILKEMYTEVLRLANTEKMSAIAFPAIGTGKAGFPYATAAQVAVETSIAEAKGIAEIHFVFLEGDEAFIAWQEAAAAAKLQPIATPNALGTEKTVGAIIASWKFDVFISHSGVNKDFAEELRSSLRLIGMNAFVDKPDLLAGNAGSDTTMIDSAGQAPVGVAVFSEPYFASEWPMRELKILMDRESLLPVLYSSMSHEEMKTALKGSPHKHVSGQAWDDYVHKVTKTTYVRWNGAYTEPLRQELCWHIVRILATGVCPKLADSTRTGMFLGKVRDAARKLVDDSDSSPFQQLTWGQIRTARKWVSKLSDQLEP